MRKIKEKGSATIFMAMTLTGIFTYVYFGIDSIRFINEKTRQENASEAASLAIATISETNSNGSVYPTIKEARNIAKSYFDNYVDNEVSLEELDVKAHRNDGIMSYIVSYKTNNPAIFYNENIVSFDKEVDISSSSLAKKTLPYFTEIKFVIDLSGSMRSRIGTVKKSVGKILDDFSKNNINVSVGIYPFGSFVNENGQCTSYYAYKGAMSHPSLGDWAYVGNKSLSKCANKGEDCNVTPQSSARELKNSKPLINKYESVDIPSTVNNWHSYYPSYKYMTINTDRGWRDGCKPGNFETIELSGDFISIKDRMYNMSVESNFGNQIFQGVLSASRSWINEESNNHKILIVITDGYDVPQKLTNNLIDSGICESIRDALGENFHFSLTSLKQSMNNSHYVRCFGDEIYQIKNLESDLYNHIYHLLSKVSDSRLFRLESR